MAIDPRRLLGFAFAGADLLIEVEEQGRITLAIGAARTLLGEDEASISGRFFGSLFAPMDRPVAEALAKGLSEGERRGPVVLRLAMDPSRATAVNAHCMIGNNRLASLALTPAVCPSVETDAKGLMSPTSFETFARGVTEAAAFGGEALEMAMVEFSGLDAACAKLGETESEGLRAAIAGAVRAESRAGNAAAVVGSERFALLRQVGENADVLAGRLSRLAAEASPGAAPIANACSFPLGDGADPQKVSRAVRFALEDFMREGLKDPSPASLAEAMNRSVQRTLERAGELGVAISQKRFQLAYQPVVDLRTGEAHHHEALVRFEDGDSPFHMIRLAEEFDLIEELDRTIVEQVVEELLRDPTNKSRIAANVSGRTIVSNDFVQNVLVTIAKQPRIRNRLIFEITESAAIQDMTRAEKHIQALRGAGSLVCIDDFGAGAASFAYLQQLTLDIVKIDGRYVRELASNGRDGALVRHLVRMCKELRVQTVAEMVENAQIEAVVREAGVDFAQGYLYGQPTDKPQAPTIAGAKKTAKRVGAVESWG